MPQEEESLRKAIEFIRKHNKKLEEQIRELEDIFLRNAPEDCMFAYMILVKRNMEEIKKKGGVCG